MTRADAVAARVRQAEPRLGDVRLVVVDGPAGSGKTTYAALLATALDDAPVVHMDDLYEGWSGLDNDVWDRLETQVLAPLRVGRPARYQIFDWAAGRFDDWAEVAHGPALVVEGVGAAARRVDGSAVLRVWVEVPRALRRERGLARAGAAQWDDWLRWAEREDRHFAGDRTRDRADLLIDGAGS